MALEGVWAGDARPPLLSPEDDIEVDDGCGPSCSDAAAGTPCGGRPGGGRGRPRPPPRALCEAEVGGSAYLAQLRAFLQRQNPRKYGAAAPLSIGGGLFSGPQLPPGPRPDGGFDSPPDPWAEAHR